MVVDAAVLHALIQDGDIKPDLGKGFGERDQVWRSAGWAGGIDPGDGRGLEL